MVSVDKAIVARVKSHGHDFEILVDCENALKLREGQNIDIRDVLAVEKVFSDASKGLKVSEVEMQQVFGTTDEVEVAREIIKKGEIQLTAEYRHKLREEKKKQIIDTIHRRGIDPRTNAPHPIIRIENAFEEARVHIDEFVPVKQQVEQILKQIRPILPIKLEIRQIAVRIPAVYAAKSYSTLKQNSKILKEEWQNNGDIIVLVEIPAGLQEDFFNKLNALTKGEIETKIIKIS